MIGPVPPSITAVAPVRVFVEIFRRFGIDVTEAEARGPMGSGKHEHIARVLAVPRITGIWTDKYGNAPTEAEIDAMYADFLPLQKTVLSAGSDVIAGVPHVIAQLRGRGLKIGSTTGYTRKLMSVVTPPAAEQGYVPDCVVCSDDVTLGRPMPWMNVRAAELLGVGDFRTIVTVDDTPVGIAAGRNGGMWSVGVALTGNALGLSASDAAALTTDDRLRRLAAIESDFRAAGAHYVVHGVVDLPPVLDDIERRLNNGERP
ncbi:MAG: phosphonoacetaldehyde hydrolase [Pirellulales bacterium]